MINHVYVNVSTECPHFPPLCQRHNQRTYRVDATVSTWWRISRRNAQRPATVQGGESGSLQCGVVGDQTGRDWATSFSLKGTGTCGFAQIHHAGLHDFRSIVDDVEPLIISHQFKLEIQKHRQRAFLDVCAHCHPYSRDVRLWMSLRDPFGWIQAGWGSTGA